MKNFISLRSSGRNGWLVFAALLLPFAAVIIFCIVSGVPDLALGGDGALLEFSERSTAEGGSFTGPYSKYGFHHPGPVYFFVRIPLYYLFGRSASASYITVSLICMLCLASVFLLLRKCGNRLMPVIFCLLAAIFLWSLKPVIWLSDWNPFVIIFPLLLTFVSFTAVAAGFHVFLPVAVAAGSFSVQTHIGCLPSVAAAAVFAGVFLVIRFKRRSNGGVPSLTGSSIARSISIASITAVILWAPVLLHELTSGSGGNLSGILRFFREASPGLSLKRSFFIWVDAVSGMEGNLLSGEYLRSAGILFHVKGIIVFLRVALLFVCCTFLYRRNRTGFTFFTGCMLLLLHLTAFLSISQVRGEPHTYLFLWFSVLGLLSWTVIFSSIAELSVLFRSDRVSRWGIPACTVIVLVFSILNTASIWNKPPGSPYDPLFYHDGQVMALGDSLSHYISMQDENGWVIIPAEHDLWPVMAGLLNSLDKEGRHVS
ncbi:hypothetical protein DRQ25_14145, partial [Candidatus Fermentibacteria bacterium]